MPKENDYINLAKSAVEIYVKNRGVLTPPLDLPPEMLENKAGVFVTIYKKGKLRGCIGTYIPVRANIAEEIISNAIAASCDPRFLPIQEEELKDLSYEVSVLGNLEEVKSLDDFDPQKYGMFVKTFNGKSGLLLPNIEGVDTPEQQFFIVCEKGGIDPGKDEFRLYRFEVERYK